MTRAFLIVSAALIPALAAAQSAPLITTGATAKAVGASGVNLTTSKTNNGGASSATMLAQNTLNSIRKFCRVAPRDEKLVAVCDDTTSGARVEHLTAYSLADWGQLAKRIADADATISGKPRGAVVVNRGDLMAEVTSAGVLRLKN